MPVQGKLGQKMGRTRRKMMEAADTRVKFINEVLQGIRVVKLYAWEHALLNRVAFLRKEELKRLLLKVKYWACLDTFNYSSPPIVLIVILGTYVLVGNELSVSKAFTVIALINVLRASIGLVAGGAFIIVCVFFFVFFLQSLFCRLSCFCCLCVFFMVLPTTNTI